VLISALSKAEHGDPIEAQTARKCHEQRSYGKARSKPLPEDRHYFRIFSNMDGEKGLISSSKIDFCGQLK